MGKLKNSLWLGFGLGLLVSIVTLVILDLTFYILKLQLGYQVLQSDVVFAISLIFTLLLLRKFIRNKNQQQIGLGMILSITLWGVTYLYLFYIRNLQTLIF